MQEQDLITQLLDRKEEAYRYCLDKHQDHIYKVCVGFLHSKEDAEDICQDVFIELFSSISSYRGGASLSTWLYRIAVNKSLNFLKKKKRSLLYEKWLGGIGSASSRKKAPDDQLENKELAGMLFKAIEALPENQKIAYTLVTYDDLSYEEIAKVMNVSLSSVESLLFRARNNLKKSLLRYYEKNYK
jgi:RNA polymerase sigma-70 factor (ECF subfamily)